MIVGGRDGSVKRIIRKEFFVRDDSRCAGVKLTSASKGFATRAVRNANKRKARAALAEELFGSQDDNVRQFNVRQHNVHYASSADF
jgi:hypothetical protein